MKRFAILSLSMFIGFLGFTMNNMACTQSVKFEVDCECPENPYTSLSDQATFVFDWDNATEAILGSAGWSDIPWEEATWSDVTLIDLVVTQNQYELNYTVDEQDITVFFESM
jgi:hypothetical protein